MKKLITILFLSLTMNCLSQSAKKDSLSFQPLTDSTWLLSWKDYTELKDKILLEMPTKYGLPVMQWFEQKLQERIAEWQRKRIKIKTP